MVLQNALFDSNTPWIDLRGHEHSLLGLQTGGISALETESLINFVEIDYLVY